MTQSHWLTPDDNEAPWRNDIKGGMYYVEGGSGGEGQSFKQVDFTLGNVVS
jgi:hypothetical protein